MVDINEVHRHSLQGIDAAYQEEIANYRRHEISGDLDGMASAAQVMASLRNMAKELNTMKHEAMAPPQQPLAGAENLSRNDIALARHYGLTAQELGVAKGWTGNSNMTDEEKVREYVGNRQRYQQARASGAYRDDQGRVTR